MSPYIAKNIRKNIKAGVFPKDAGELNYTLTKIILDYLPKEPRYKDYNEVMGVIECLKLEFYRRAIAIYESEKCKLNGDVYQ